MWRWTVSPEAAPDAAEYLDIEFKNGDIVALNGKAMSPATVLAELNRIGGKHGIGRLDLVENRYVGMKSRGCYETPGGTIMLRAHRAIESITLDREVAHLKDDLMPRYASLIYNGYWWSPERQALQTLIDHRIKAASILAAKVQPDLKAIEAKVDSEGRITVVMSPIMSESKRRPNKPGY